MGLGKRGSRGHKYLCETAKAGMSGVLVDGEEPG